MSKTILHVIDNLGMGGSEILLVNTIPSLTDFNHIIVYLGGDNSFAANFKNYQVYSLHHTGKRTMLRSAWRLRNLIKIHKADIVHAHLMWSSFIARLAKPSGVRLITTIHSVLSKDAFEKNKLSLWMERLTTNRQDDIIGVSQFVITDYLQHVSFKGRTHLLYNLIPDFFLKNKTSVIVNIPFKGVIRCVAVGNLKEVKNYSFILEAFGKLPADQFKLDIIGEGGLRSILEKKIAANNLAVQLLGRKDDVQSILPKYNVFIQASAYEGFGIALAEAIGIGLIPVLSDIPVHREVTANNAWYFDLDDPQNLINAIISLRANQLDSSRMNLMQQHIKDISSADYYFKALRDIYSTN